MALTSPDNIFSPDAGDEYALNEDLAAMADSVQDALTALGTWTSYTPTVTASSGTYTTVTSSGRYTRVGKLVVAQVRVRMTNRGTATGNLSVSLPVTASTVGSHVAVGSGRETALSGAMLQIFNFTPTTAMIQTFNGATAIINGYDMVATITYEAA